MTDHVDLTCTGPNRTLLELQAGKGAHDKKDRELEARNCELEARNRELEAENGEMLQAIRVYKAKNGALNRELSLQAREMTKLELEMRALKSE